MGNTGDEVRLSYIQENDRMGNIEKRFDMFSEALALLHDRLDTIENKLNGDKDE